MAFVTSTSKIPTAVIGHASGFLTGNLNHSFVVLNRGNILSFFKVQDGALAESVAHIQDFRMHCTIKYLHALPIYDPITKKLLRHVLFLFTTKQEISIVALDSTRDKYVMVTLFFGHLTELYQSRLNLTGQSISCSTSSCPAGVPVLTPFVAFGVSEGDLYFIDILSAIGSTLQRKKCPHRTKISRYFPSSVISVMEERGKHEYFIKRPFHPLEFEVRSLAFGAPVDGGEVLPLYVLYADHHYRVHIAEYAFHLNPPTPAAKAGSSVAAFIACAGGDQKLIRKGNLQGDVDPTSNCVLVSRDSVICVGSQLLTCVQRTRKRPPRTFELPFLGSVATEVSAAAVLPDDTVMVCVLTGACAVVRIHPTEDNEPWSDLSSSSHNTPIISHCADMGTIATGVLPIGPRMCLLPSNLEDTIVMNIGSWESCSVIDHCGPVIDMTVVNDGATQMVLASTGVERRGGVSALRCVMRLTSEQIIQVSDDVTSIFAAQDLIVMSSYGKICAAVFCEGQLDEIAFPNPVENEEEGGVWGVGLGDAVGLYFHDNSFIFVHEHGLMWLCWRKTSQGNRSLVCKHSIAFTDVISFSDFLDGVLMVAAENHSITCVKNSEIAWTVPTESTVSAMAMDPSSNRCVVGQWDGSVCILDLSTRRVTGRMVLSSVPHSICCVPNASNRGDAASTVLIGLMNGYLCETTTSLLTQQRRYRHYFFLMNRPVSLVTLQGKNAVIALGPAPMIVLMTAEGCEITGFSVNGISSCGSLVENSRKQFVFHSKSRNTLHIGGMENTQKINRTFIPLGGTVTLVRAVPEWAGFVVSLRRNNRECVVFLPSSTIQSPWKEESFALVQQCELLENEQCTFLNVITLPHNSQEVSFSGSGEGHTVVLVGTGFLFRDEQKARSSRVMWFSQGNKGQLNPVGEKDIKGSLQSCCVIPDGKGTIALAVSGIVLLCQWSPREQTFLQKEQLCVGLLLFSLMPMTPLTLEKPGKGEASTASTATIVALDIRHGAFYLEVNIDQGTMKILSKDHCLRSTTSGALLPTGITLISDSNDNIFAMQNNTEEITATETQVETAKKAKLQIEAQMHVGQCINCMQRGSFSPAAVIGEYSQSMRLFRGSMGAQVVYGTAGGGFGTITPVGIPFYFVLRSIEFAVSTVVAPAGSFEPDFYREILIPGQERSFNRKASQVGLRSHDQTLSRRRCVDGDVIEGFLGMSVDERQDVLNIASKTAVGWWPALKALLEDNESTLDFAGDPVAAVADPEYAQEKCNEVLAKAELPSLPFTDGHVQHLIFDLRKLH